MPKKSFTIEHALYLAVILLAIALRLVNLGSFPLSEFEADWAMQAYDLQNGNPVQIGPQPLYVVFTSLLFSLAGSSEFAARLLPFLAGILLVCLPYFYRDHLGPKAALLLAFGLAIDPTLVGLSRLAGSSIIALAFSLAALTAWLRGAARPAGAFLALALLSGPVFLAGLLSLALTWALAHFLIPDFDFPIPSREQISFRTLSLSAAATLLIAGTLFLRFPQGLSSLGLSLPAYFSGWWTPSGAPLIQIFFALLAYHSLPIIFAALAVWRAWKSQNNHLDRWLSLWLLSAFLLTISNPSRHPADLLWMLLPLWTLAARRIALDLSWQKEDGYPAWGQAALTVLLFTFLVMTAVRLSSAPYATTALSSFQLFGQLFVINQQTVSLVSIFTLGILSTALIGAGWSPADAIRGLVWGSAAFLAVFTLSTAWKPAQSPHNASRELWFPSPGSGNVSSLSTFIGDFSEYSTGLRTGIEIVSTYESDLLHWELRHFPQVRFVASFPDDQSPAALLTDQTTDNPRLAAAYRGKAISILQTPLWAQMSASQWQRWMLFREISFQNESVILWVRSDVFPEDFSLLEDLEAQSEWITP